jgi:hypothetical protein
MDKRYQVFVSSTYADLKEERGRVIQTLMESDCIPAGMELFPAMDEGQLNFIKRVIDDCDYYILIIGGRYGSTMPDGVSYTEKEYDYAIERGIKVLAFLHEKPNDISVEKSDIDPVLRSRLNDFRDKASKNRLVKYWTKAEELPGLVALSLSKTIKAYPAIGWVRANHIANVDVLGELNDLYKRNDELEKRVAELGARPPIFDDLADLDDFVDLAYRVDLTWNRIQIKFRNLFKIIAPRLSPPILESYVREELLTLLESLAECEFCSALWIDSNHFLTIKYQFIALGLIVVNADKYWSITTPKGEDKLLELYIRRKPKQVISQCQETP